MDDDSDNRDSIESFLRLEAGREYRRHKGCQGAQKCTILHDARQLATEVDRDWHCEWSICDRKHRSVGTIDHALFVRLPTSRANSVSMFRLMSSAVTLCVKAPLQ